MSFLEICVLGVGLAMDAFAIAICKGLNMKKINYGQGIIIALFFGFFQFLMPVIGYFFCSQFEQYISNLDHWIVFVLLAFIGIKMIIEAIKEKDEKNELTNDSNVNKNAKNKKNEIEKSKNIVSKSEKSITTSDKSNKKLNIKELFILAVATSIDALAIGISLAFLNVNIWVSGGIIGIITFVISFFGVIIGNFFGEKFKKPAEITGGVILVLIGVKILLEHLGILII